MTYYLIFLALMQNLMIFIGIYLFKAAHITIRSEMLILKLMVLYQVIQSLQNASGSEIVFPRKYDTILKL